jgi:ribosomal protein L19
MTKIHAGDKVIRDTAIVNQDKVHLGDFAPVFVRAGDKVVRDTATVNQGNVHLGDFAPVFGPRK